MIYNGHVFVPLDESTPEAIADIVGDFFGASEYEYTITNETPMVRVDFTAEEISDTVEP